MKFTKIKYEYRGYHGDEVVLESETRCGDVSYYENVLNRIESLIDSGATVTGVERYE